MTISNEIWHPIKDYENLYLVSTKGRIKNIRKNRIWNGHKVRNGYLKVSLCKDNTKKNRFVHDIVAETFLEKKEGCTEVDHIDRNPANNDVTNLRWVSHSGNMRNRLNNKTLTIDGINKTLVEWSEISNVDYHTIKKRLYNGWSEKDAVFKTVSTKRTMNKEYKRKPNYNSILYEFNGESHTLSEWARITGLNVYTLRSRNHMGWSIEDILTRPIISKKRRTRQ